MTYKFRDMVAMLFVGMIIGVLIVGAVIADARADIPRDDAEGVAECITEFSYTHQGSRYDKLVRAIQWCNVIDGAVAHQCITPCVVILPKGVLEDEFRLNYGWRNRHTPFLDIWVHRNG